MLTDVLWFLNAKYQYEQQRRLGIAGLFGLILPILIGWKWNDWFFPLAQKFGLVAFADRHGMIADMPIGTALHVGAALLAVALILWVGFLIVFILLTTFGLLGSTGFGRTLLALPIILFFSPVIIVISIREHLKNRNSVDVKLGMVPTYKKDPELRPLLMKYKDTGENLKGLELYTEQREREGDAILPLYDKHFLKLLNRAISSIKTDRNWAIGYDIRKKQCYMMFPNPLPVFASKCAEYNPMRPYNIVYKFGILDIQRFTKNPLSREYHVPALPIDLVWDAEKQKIVPSIPVNAKMTLTNTVFIKHQMNCNHPDFEEVQDIASRRDDVYGWNRTAHVMLYFIPRVFPFQRPTEGESEISQAVKEIPNADAYYSHYASDVFDCEQHFKNINEDYATIQIKKFRLDKIIK